MMEITLSGMLGSLFFLLKEKSSPLFSLFFKIKFKCSAFSKSTFYLNFATISLQHIVNDVKPYSFPRGLLGKAYKGF